MIPEFAVRNSVIVRVSGAFAPDTDDESRVEFTLACRRLTRLDAHVNEKRARAILLDIVEAWADVTLPDGAPAPFDRASLKHLLRYRNLPMLAYRAYLDSVRSAEANLVECAQGLVAGLEGEDAQLAADVERRAQDICTSFRYGRRPDLSRLVFIWPEHEHAVRVFASLVACRARELVQGGESSMDAIAGLLVRSVPASYAPKLLGYLQVMSAAISAEGAAASEPIQ